MSIEAMKQAYLAGFMASGEGYNGEYPFQDKGRNPEDDPAWCRDRDNALYTTPPAAQRQWVGLTDEEHDEIIKQCAPLDSRYVAAIVESRLREKNT